MKPITSIYLKLFLTNGLTFGLLMALWDYIDEGKIIFLKLFFMTVLFGGFMSWTTVTSMKRSKHKFGEAELSEKDFNPTQIELTPKNKSIEEIYNLLKSCEITKNWKLKIENSRITGKTKVSWSTWGERIKITDLNDRIEIESKSLVCTTLFDNGKNYENVNFLKGLIEKL